MSFRSTIASVKTIMDTFRRVYRELNSTFPTLKIFYHYAAKRGPTNIHPNLCQKTIELKSIATELFPDPEVKINLIGSRQLLELGTKGAEDTL